MDSRLKYLLIVLLFLATNNCLSQKLELTGRVIDRNTSEPLAYVTIVVKDKLIGTFSDENGLFRLAYATGDSLIISHVGYERASLYAEGVKDVIRLKPAPYVFREITINSSRKKVEQTLGIDRKKIESSMGGVLQYAMFIDNPEKRPGVIKNLHFEVAHSVNRDRQDRMNAKIRIRLYERNSATGQPGPDILVKEKIVVVRPNQKDIRVDVSEEAIPFPLEGLFVGIDILGFVNESGKLVNYHINEAKKHIRIPLSTSINKPLTYINPIGQKWVLCETLNSKTGKLGIANACFEITVEF